MPLAPSLLLAVLLAASVASAQSTPAANPAPARLRSETVSAFDRYVRLTEERNDMELKRGSSLLWIDSLPETQRAETYTALKRGDVQIHQLSTLDAGKPIVCPGGMIHHWVGAVFIPGASWTMYSASFRITIINPNITPRTWSARKSNSRG